MTSIAPPTYRVSTTLITGLIIPSSLTCLTLWHPASSNKTVELFLVQQNLNRVSKQTGSVILMRFQFFTAENVVPGGVLLTPQPLTRGSPASELTVRQIPLPPTFTGSPVTNFLIAPAVDVTLTSTHSIYLNQQGNLTQPITLRAGQAEGVAITQVVTGSAPDPNSFALTAEWTES